jgi:hypothetical protein
MHGTQSFLSKATIAMTLPRRAEHRNGTCSQGRWHNETLLTLLVARAKATQAPEQHTLAPPQPIPRVADQILT